MTLGSRRWREGTRATRGKVQVRLELVVRPAVNPPAHEQVHALLRRGPQQDDVAPADGTGEHGRGHHVDARLSHPVPLRLRSLRHVEIHHVRKVINLPLDRGVVRQNHLHVVALAHVRAREAGDDVAEAAHLGDGCHLRACRARREVMDFRTRRRERSSSEGSRRGYGSRSQNGGFSPGCGHRTVASVAGLRSSPGASTRRSITGAAVAGARAGRPARRWTPRVRVRVRARRAFSRSCCSAWLEDMSAASCAWRSLRLDSAAAASVAASSRASVHTDLGVGGGDGGDGAGASAEPRARGTRRGVARGRRRRRGDVADARGEPRARRARTRARTRRAPRSTASARRGRDAVCFCAGGRRDVDVLNRTAACDARRGTRRRGGARPSSASASGDDRRRARGVRSDAGRRARAGGKGDVALSLANPPCYHCLQNIQVARHLEIMRRRARPDRGFDANDAR